MPTFSRVSVTLAGALALAPLLAPSAAAAHTSFPSTIPLPAGSQPEGITSGPGTTFYAGARLDGAVTTGDLRTGVTRTLVAGDTFSQTTAITAFVKAYNAMNDMFNQATAYDATTGAELARYVVAGSRFLNDVEVTRTAVYVTDSLNAELVVVPLGKHRSLPKAATLLPLRGDFAELPGFDANGIRALPGGQLVINRSADGALFRVNPKTGVADRIETTGRVLTSGDGLELRGSTLYDVYGFSRDGIAVIKLGDGARTATVQRELTDSDLDRPTTTTLVAGALWTVNGRFSTPPTPTTPYSVVRVSTRR